MIMVPMYIYPATTAWDPIITSIGCNPTVKFKLIINPDSGPGASVLPNSDYISGIVKLRRYPNVKLLGYVHTTYGSEPAAAIQANITKYSKWKTNSNSKIYLDGIFFDEAPSTWNPSTGLYMTNLTTFARQNFTSVTFNPGTFADVKFFNLADNIVIFENAYSAWTPSVVTNLNATYNAAQKAKSVIMMYGFTGKAIKQYDVSQTMMSMNISGLFISNKNGYTAVSDIWGIFVGLLGLSNSGL
jgi:hypothetical protein